jgi:GR25 family glycosyltransferase involved in LPS biosynthesis
MKQLEEFLLSGNVQKIVDCLSEYRLKNEYTLCLIIAEYIEKFFPNNIAYLSELALVYYDLREYRKAYDVYQRILSFKKVDSKFFLHNQHYCIPFIKDDYTFYNREIVDKLKLNMNSQNVFPFITFTITTCKRYDLFEKTMNSFLNCCLDVHEISHFFCVDDNSSEEDRQKMRERYPFFEFYFKTPSEKGHPRSMNIIRDKVKTPYIFGMEDDWCFISKRKYITECLEVMGARGDLTGGCGGANSQDEENNIKQCLINKNYAETERDINVIGGIPMETDSGLRYYIHDHYEGGNKEQEQLFISRYGYGPNSGYWPGFSFRPSLYKRELFIAGPFDERVSHFEMNYANRFLNTDFKFAFLEGIYSLHTGRLTSERNDETKANAYTLNGEKQLHGKEGVSSGDKSSDKSSDKSDIPGITVKTTVINLDKRVDRWETFVKKPEPKFLNYVRFSAIDGSKLKPTEQLQRIFDGNDYNMRQGMVGCALSHIKLYTDIAKDIIKEAGAGAKDNDDKTFYCIFEDDIEFVPDFQNKFVNVIKQLSQTDFDLCYLGHHVWDKNLRDWYNRQTMPIIEKWDTKTSLSLSIGGTGGYILSKKGALSLLNMINNTGMTNGIDTMQQKSADTLSVWYAFPHLIYSECATTNANTDTDIQHNYGSLTRPLMERFEEDMILYKNEYPGLDVYLFNDENEFIKKVQDKECVNVCMYNGGKVKSLLDDVKRSMKPFYTLSYDAIVVVPKPTKKVESVRYFDRLKKDGVFNINDALEKKSMKGTLISFADNTHVAEAIVKINGDKGLKTFPFDKTDEQTLEVMCLLTELVLEMSDERLKEFLKEFFNIDKNETYVQSFNNKTVFRNLKYKISFPHDDIKGIEDVYFERFKNLRDTIKGGDDAENVENAKNDKNIYLVHCTRFLTDYKPELEYLLTFLHKYNKNIKIMTINGVKPEGGDTGGDIIKEYVPFPEEFKNQDWTYEKVKYDQEVFRVAVATPICKIYDMLCF